MNQKQLLIAVGFGVASFACLLSAGACGGSVAHVPGVDSGSATSPPPDGPWGIWRMTGLDGPRGVPASEPAPNMQLELRPDGTAWRSRCADSNEARCPSELTYDCLAGTVAWDGTRWHVDIPGIHVGVPEQGDIVNEPDGILVRYIYPTYSGGHFRHVDDGLGSCTK